MKQFLYIRVSTDTQEYDRQIYLLNNAGYNSTNSIIYQETYSAKTMNRPQLTKMLDEIAENDVVIVESLSRLARSTKDLLNICELLQKKKASLISLKESIDMTTPIGKFFISVMGAINQLERDTAAQRTKEALGAKKAKGAKLGRPHSISTETYNMAIDEYLNTEQSYREVAKKYGMSDVTLVKAVKARRMETFTTSND